MKAVIIIAIAFVLLVPTTVFAQEYIIFVQIDKEVYYEGESVVVSGKVRSISGDFDEPATITIFERDSRFKKIAEEKVMVTQDGSFTKTFDSIMEDKSWKEGKYDVIVFIGDNAKGERFSYFITDNLENGCPEYFPDLDSDGLCYDLPELEPVKEHVGMRWYQNELYDYSFDIPTNWEFDEKDVSIDGTTIGMRLWPEEFYPPPADIKIIFKNLPESDVPELNSEAIENYLRDSVLTIPSVRIIDSYSQSEDWGWTATVEIRYLQSNIEPHEVRKMFVFEDRETYFVNFGAANEERFDEYYPVYQRVLENLVIKSVAVPEFGSIAMLILAISVISIVIFTRRFNVIRF